VYDTVLGRVVKEERRYIKPDRLEGITTYCTLVRTHAFMILSESIPLCQVGAVVTKQQLTGISVQQIQTSPASTTLSKAIAEVTIHQSFTSFHFLLNVTSLMHLWLL
jgi:hypothetical protein